MMASLETAEAAQYNGGQEAAPYEGDSAPYESFDELERLIEDAYERETEEAAGRGEKRTFRLQAKDLHLRRGKSGSRPATTKLEVIDSYRTLLDRFSENEAYLEHISSVEHAFVQLSEISRADYSKIKSLVDLLAHSVENHHRDPCVESRFVTLLEILLSYGRNWEPSSQISRSWVLLRQDLPSDIAPVSFRRKAYRVLVSLSWVPSSSGLLEACSWDAAKQTIDFSKEAPNAGVDRVVSQIRGGQPRPRFDNVNQLLDRLKDETDVCVAITTGKDGMGKTTLAAQVASHHSIRRVFTVLWLDIGGDESYFSYDRYTKYLDELCDQLSVKLEWPQVPPRFEEPALRMIREEALMLQAKERISQVFVKKGANFLLVLDDIEDASLIKWFRFVDRQSVIVTTLNSDLEGVDWTVELEPMSEGESIELFLLEADLPRNHILGSTVEVHSIVRRCGYSPLIIRSVARWFQLKTVTAGLTVAIQEVVADMDNLVHAERETADDASEEEPNMLLFDIISLMMGPSRADVQSTSVLFVLCIAALVVVFPEKVPLDAVLLLWEQVLLLEPHAVDELCREGSVQTGNTLRRHAWFIAEGMLHMGILQITEGKGGAWVEIQHKLYKEFAFLMARELDFKGSFEETVIGWNKTFVTAYIEQRIQGDSSKIDDNSWVYALEHLPSHMVIGKMMPTLETILVEQNFFKARIEAMGWKPALKAHIADCISLQSSLEDAQDTVSPVFSQTMELIKELAEPMLQDQVESVGNEIAQSLSDLGIALAEIRCYEKALEFFGEAQCLVESDSLLGSLLYGEAWTLLSTNETEQALLRGKACHDIMCELSEPHVMFKDMLQLVAHTLVAECQYKEAAEFYALVCDKMKVDAESSAVELGCTLHSTAKLHLTMGETQEARTVYEECLALKKAMGEISKNMAVAFASLGDVYLELGQLNEATVQYETSLAAMDELEILYSDLDYRLVKGKLWHLRGDIYICNAEFESVRNVIGERPEVMLDKSAYDLRCIAQIYRQRGETDKSVEYLHESLALTFSRPMSLERASGMHLLGKCLIEQKVFEEALVFLEKALEIQIVKLGESIPVLDSLKTIGNVHIELGSYDEALTVFDKVLEVSERLEGNDPQKRAEILYWIGGAYQGKKEYEEAAVNLNESIRLVKEEVSAEHGDIGKALHRLGDIEREKEDLAKAREYYTQALQIRKMNFDDSLVAETSHALGYVQRRLGELDSAQELLFTALDIRRGLKDAHQQTGETLLEIGHIYRLKNDMESAESIYEKGLEVIDEMDEVAGDTIFALAQIQVTKSEYQEALARFERVRDFRVSKYGRDSMKTGCTSRSLGQVQFLRNDQEQAMVHLNEFVRVYELQDEDASETVDYAMAVFLLGDIHNKRNNAEQAENLWTIAKEVCDDNDFDKQVPEFVAMINRRLEGAGDHEKKGGGFLSKLAGISNTELLSDPEERKVVENLVFVDDY